MQSHDEARIQVLKDDMDGVLINLSLSLFFPQSQCMVIQAGLFFAALTSFIIDRIHDLRVGLAQQMVYY